MVCSRLFRFYRFAAVAVGQCQRIRHAEDDTPQSDYERRLGLGAKLKNKNTPDTEEKQQ